MKTAPPPAPPADTSTDGRSARRERTRTAIADAMLSLIEDGDLRPTAPRVAERAGVSLRSVFQHFQDMEAIYAAVAERQIERMLATAKFIAREGLLGDRIRAFAAERARLHEAVTPVRRAALLIEPFSPGIAERLRWVRDLGGIEVAKVFRLELAQLPTKDRRDALEALTVAASWSAWEALRAHQGLSPAQAERVVRRTVEALLEKHPAMKEPAR
ncbi:MAG: TetR/AcrR family transcriptional regulator [Chloroflexi bacterium]|nr:TetR/AcrR family transcriptional regulator [Chloroflexota bacterium]